MVWGFVWALFAFVWLFAVYFAACIMMAKVMGQQRRKGEEQEKKEEETKEGRTRPAPAYYFEGLPTYNVEGVQFYLTPVGVRLIKGTLDKLADVFERYDIPERYEPGEA